ncbi:XRE family transcriptional regulator [Ferruginivarius sediminum]|nr:XRE family transcriptional regulator [Ferruginivarius sediminum]
MAEEDEKQDNEANEDRASASATPEETTDTGFATLGNRVRAVLNHYRTRAEAARIAGRSTDQLQLYVRGRTEPGLEVMARLCRGPGISLDWLATGKGSMKISERSASNPSNREYNSDIHLPRGYMLRPDTQEPVYSDLIVDSLTFRADYLRSLLGREPTDIFLLRIDGDAMEPTLRAGDLCLVDAQKTRVSASGLYALLIDGAPQVRRVDLDRNGVNIIADNTHYPPKHVPENRRSHTDVLGRIVCIENKMQ